MIIVRTPRDVIVDCVSQLAPVYKEKYSDFDIYIYDDKFRIKYNHHIYVVKVILQDDEYYFHLKPYNKSYYTTKVDNLNSFDMVIHAIKDNELYQRKPVKK